MDLQKYPLMDMYRKFALGDAGDVYKQANIQRKCTTLAFAAACTRSDNMTSCELLKHKLDEYTQTVHKDGENIYNKLLNKEFPDITTKRRFKVPTNLTKPDFEKHLKKFDCPESHVLFCSTSEKTSKAELDQFADVFRKENCDERPALKTRIVNLEERFANLDKLQGRLQPSGDNYIKKTSNFPKDTYFNKPSNKQQPKPENASTKKSFAHFPSFSTARDEMENQTNQKVGMKGNPQNDDYAESSGKKTLGVSRRTVRSKFVSPLLSARSNSNNDIDENPEKTNSVQDERLKNIDPKMVELIKAEIMDQGPTISWNDIAGLEFAKTAIQEAVVWPMLRPDIFTGLRRPPKGILLFGPPGTGKTLIGKCVASQSKSTFFCISASSLTSKWIGDGEKMVRALFAVARVHQPAVIFIDEIDSLLTQRSDTEHESSRRIKTEFLVQLDGATTDSEERLLVIGATNRPQELDEAARRRFVKRLYIPLPEFQGRLELLKNLISKEPHSITDEEYNEIARLSDGYSGADIKNLCSEAALGPIRSMDFRNIESIQASDVRPLSMVDFQKSLKTVRPSVSQDDLIHYIQWDTTYGTGSGI